MEHLEQVEQVLEHLEHKLQVVEGGFQDLLLLQEEEGDLHSLKPRERHWSLVPEQWPGVALSRFQDLRWEESLEGRRSSSIHSRGTEEQRRSSSIRATGNRTAAPQRKRERSRSTASYDNHQYNHYVKKHNKYTMNNYLKIYPSE